jgi:hypothetical protein
LKKFRQDVEEESPCPAYDMLCTIQIRATF